MNLQLLAHLREVLVKLTDDERKSFILMSPNSLGEVSTICALLKSFREHHQSNVTLVVPNAQRDIPSVWGHNIQKLIVSDSGTMRALSYLNLIDKDRFEKDHPINTWSFQRGDGRLDSIHELRATAPHRGGLNYTDMYRYILHLPWNAKIEFGKIPDQWITIGKKILEEHGLDPERSVILFPGNNSNRPAPTALWRSISNLYNKLGYQVVLNLRGALFIPSDLKVPSIRLDLNIPAAIALGHLCGNVVIGSNGLKMLMLLMKINANINVLLPTAISRDGETQHAVPHTFGSAQLLYPEYLLGFDTYQEWLTSDDDAKAEQLASDIVLKNLDSDFLLTRSKLSKMLTMDTPDQFQGLTWS
jgi:hypothetical protein